MWAVYSNRAGPPKEGSRRSQNAFVTKKELSIDVLTSSRAPPIPFSISTIANAISAASFPAPDCSAPALPAALPATAPKFPLPSASDARCRPAAAGGTTSTTTTTTTTSASAELAFDRAHAATISAPAELAFNRAASHRAGAGTIDGDAAVTTIDGDAAVTGAKVTCASDAASDAAGTYALSEDEHALPEGDGALDAVGGGAGMEATAEMARMQLDADEYFAQQRAIEKQCRDQGASTELTEQQRRTWESTMYNVGRDDCRPDSTGADYVFVEDILTKIREWAKIAARGESYPVFNLLSSSTQFALACIGVSDFCFKPYFDAPTTSRLWVKFSRLCAVQWATLRTLQLEAEKRMHGTEANRKEANLLQAAMPMNTSPLWHDDQPEKIFLQTLLKPDDAHAVVDASGFRRNSGGNTKNRISTEQSICLVTADEFELGKKTCPCLFDMLDEEAASRVRQCPIWSQIVTDLTSVVSDKRMCDEERIYALMCLTVVLANAQNLSGSAAALGVIKTGTPPVSLRADEVPSYDVCVFGLSSESALAQLRSLADAARERPSVVLCACLCVLLAACYALFAFAADVTTQNAPEHRPDDHDRADAMLATPRMRLLRRGMLMLDVARHPEKLREDLKRRSRTNRIIRNDEQGGGLTHLEVPRHPHASGPADLSPDLAAADGVSSAGGAAAVGSSSSGAGSGGGGGVRSAAAAAAEAAAAAAAAEPRTPADGLEAHWARVLSSVEVLSQLDGQHLAALAALATVRKYQRGDRLRSPHQARISAGISAAAESGGSGGNVVDAIAAGLAAASGPQDEAAPSAEAAPLRTFRAGSRCSSFLDLLHALTTPVAGFVPALPFRSASAASAAAAPGVLAASSSASLLEIPTEALRRPAERNLLGTALHRLAERNRPLAFGLVEVVLLRLALVTCDTIASYIELPPALCPKPALAAPPSLPGAWRAPELAALRLFRAPSSTPPC
ncbi:hypothetical protein EMIHUDRAFT_120102, partial [Emiliania huxleyi CCMP1516]|uniref:Uncharacterized protein n=2 Tax=Emiliania huxleyi TaxID=2903 RepID=A0A0D3IML7_EMIH1